MITENLVLLNEAVYVWDLVISIRFKILVLVNI